MQEDPETPPPPLNPERQLQQDIEDETTEILRGMLPPPLIDTPEARARRNRVAIATVANFVPACSAETRLAARHAAALAHSEDCTMQAVHYRNDPKRAGQLHAQAASMGREARGFFNALMRLQAVRRKRDANDDTRESAARTEHCVYGSMTQALERLPPEVPAAPAPEPEVAALAGVAARGGAAAKAAQAAPPVVKWRAYEDWTDEEKRLDRLSAKASRYAILNPVRVALIRKLGGLPPDCDYEPPDDELLHEIIHGTHPNLVWAESYVPWVHPDLRPETQAPS